MRKFAYGAALSSRLGQGDSVTKTLKWFVKHVIRKELRNATPKERKFWMGIVNGHLQLMNRNVTR